MALGIRSLPWIALLLIVVGVALFVFYGPGTGSSEAGTVDRDLAAAYFDEERYDRARQALERVIELEGSSALDRVSLACVELADPAGDLRRAGELLDAASRIDDDLAELAYARGVLAKREQRLDDAAAQFARAVERRPEDLPSRLNLGEVYDRLDRRDEAAAVYREIVGGDDDDRRGSWSLTAIYRLGHMLVRGTDDTERASGLELLRLHRELSDSGIRGPDDLELDLGELCRVRAPRPTPRIPAAASAELTPGFEPLPERWLADFGSIRSVLAAHVDDDDRPDLLALTDSGIALALARPGGTYDQRRIADGDWTRVLAADLDNGGVASLLLVGADGDASLLVARDGAWRAYEPDALRALTVRDALFVDIDHEGDLDLLVLHDDRVVLLRNDGRGASAGEGPVTLTRVDPPAPWPTGRFDWIAVEDFDADSDIDFVVGGASSATILASSLRGGSWSLLDQNASRLPDRASAAPLLADLDHDGFVDALFPDRASWLRNRGDGTFDPEAPLTWLDPSLPGAVSVLADVNLDGELDLVTTAAEGAIRIIAGSLVAGRGALLEPGARLPAGTSPIVVDLDGDADLDLLGVTEGGVEIQRGLHAGGASSLRVLLEGRKDNRSGVGAVVEVRAGTIFQRRLATSRELVFGLGPSTRAEVVRITWPNGVSQQVLEPDLETPLALQQREGLIGSCPFLYTWNGERYEFISDVLGITPLGLPMTEGRYVPPDHDEFIRVESSQLEPADGEYRMFVTEELREVTYLDRAELWVVDHAADVEVHPEERFTFPPFPPHRIHALEQRLPLVRAVGSDGRDWTAELAERDELHAAPFSPRPPQFLGLVTPHHLDLELPPEAAGAGRVRLMMTGWLHWTDASVNVAAGHHEEYEFVPPLLMVPDGRGGWRPTGPPVGFPAGKTKTMVLDIGELIRRDDLRLRVYSTIRLYWDEIRVAIGDDAPYTVTKIEPSRADLDYRGFSRRLPGLVPDAPEHDQPEWFEFERREPWPRWDQHEGMLTRYGDVLPLLDAIDDRFAIFSAGDAIDLRFPAPTAPAPRAGGARTYLLFLDGWAKDGDHNTYQAQTVEPLPFHGMSGYPYRDDEAYPDDETHRRYRAEWNTRRGAPLRSVLPRGEAPDGLAGDRTR